MDKVFFGKNGKFLSEGLLGTFYCNSWGGKGRSNTNEQFRQARVKLDYINRKRLISCNTSSGP